MWSGLGMSDSLPQVWLDLALLLHPLYWSHAALSYMFSNSFYFISLHFTQRMLALNPNSLSIVTEQ